MKRSGAQIVIESLCRNKVKTVFGYPGGAVLPIYDELYKNSHRLNHVLCAHEQNAAHAADGFARVTGKPGVVISTSGPGATNLVTGIANAYLDSVPLVAITGNVAVPLLGKDSFQEVDITGITQPIVKHNFAVSDVKELSGILDAAFEIASSGRPGPVLVDIPKSIQTDVCDESEFVVQELFFNDLPEADLSAAVAAITEAERPLIYSGGGVVASGASEELRTFAERISAPVAFSMMGLTALPAGHPANLGMCGMHGSQSSAKLQSECDLIIALGVRFSDRATGNTAKYKQGKKLIHVDIDLSEINKNTDTDIELCGDVKTVLQKLLVLLPQQFRPQWQKQVSEAKKLDLPPEENSLTPRTLLKTVAKYCEADTVVATDVGQHQMWTMQYFPFRSPRTLLTSGGLGTMGFGLGAAIGGCIANDRERTVLFTGDGSFGMCLQELATAVSQKLPLLIVIFNNGVLGMVRQWQTMFYEQHYSSTTLNRKTDFPALAKAFGAEGKKVTALSELEKALTTLAPDTPTVLDCQLDMDEFVLPMIPPGGSVQDLVTRRN
ncbi:MAG: biosynthetic-type acetolactate synthase large subunit [Lentisphaerae bacterium]|nr:biosynthetic-type acetolactate synthase large subunit [Lentisphaerota bacterium]